MLKLPVDVAGPEIDKGLATGVLTTASSVNAEFPPSLKAQTTRFGS
jgi:hypothetical protein